MNASRLPRAFDGAKVVTVVTVTVSVDVAVLVKWDSVATIGTGKYEIPSASRERVVRRPRVNIPPV